MLSRSESGQAVLRPHNDARNITLARAPLSLPALSEAICCYCEIAMHSLVATKDIFHHCNLKPYSLSIAFGISSEKWVTLVSRSHRGRGLRLINVLQLQISLTSGAPWPIHIVPKNWVGTRIEACNFVIANEMKQSVVMCEIAALYIIALI